MSLGSSFALKVTNLSYLVVIGLTVVNCIIFHLSHDLSKSEMQGLHDFVNLRMILHKRRVK